MASELILNECAPHCVKIDVALSQSIRFKLYNDGSMQRNRDIKNNAFVTVNNDFCVTHEAIRQ